MSVEYTFCELREREVVNVADGKKLGRITDIAFNEKGQVVGLIVPGDRRFIKNLTGSDNLFVPYNCVLKIGNDVILVDLNNMGCCPPPPPRICC
jgi:YlmC/YmxH family sporulation protein